MQNIWMWNASIESLDTSRGTNLRQKVKRTNCRKRFDRTLRRFLIQGGRVSPPHRGAETVPRRILGCWQGNTRHFYKCCTLPDKREQQPPPELIGDTLLYVDFNILLIICISFVKEHLVPRDTDNELVGHCWWGCCCRRGDTRILCENSHAQSVKQFENIYFSCKQKGVQCVKALRVLG